MSNLIHVFEVAEQKQVAIRCSNTGEMCILAESESAKTALAQAKRELNKQIKMITALQKCEDPTNIKEWHSIADEVAEKEETTA